MPTNPHRGERAVTAMASWDLGTGMGLDLECDGCGYVLLLPGADAHEWRRFWKSAVKVGWSGTGQPSGPHSCPDCASGAPAQAA